MLITFMKIIKFPNFSSYNNTNKQIMAYYKIA